MQKKSLLSISAIIITILLCAVAWAGDHGHPIEKVGADLRSRMDWLEE